MKKWVSAITLRPFVPIPIVLLSALLITAPSTASASCDSSNALKMNHTCSTVAEAQAKAKEVIDANCTLKTYPPPPGTDGGYYCEGLGPNPDYSTRIDRWETSFQVRMQQYWGNNTWAGVFYSSNVDPVKNNECDQSNGCTTAGNPINMFVGNKMEVASDYRSPSSKLELKRLYTSSSQYSSQGMLGKEWRFSYENKIVPDEIRVTVGQSVVRASGNSYFFQKDAAGQWVSDANTRLKLVQTSQGWIVTADDVREYYNTAGVLVRIEFPDSDVVTLTYGNGLLQSAADRQGRVISFQYSGELVSGVTLPDGSALGYQYNNGRLVLVQFILGDQNVGQLQYSYTNASFPSALTSITDENDNIYASWQYDSIGRATSSMHGDPSGGVDKFSITFGEGSSTVTSPLGSQVVYGFAEQFARAKLTSAQKICPACGPQGDASRVYDVNGNPDVLTDFSGSQTDQDYNNRGLLTQSIDAVNDLAGSKRTTQTDWHPTFDVPLERRIYNAADELIAKFSWTYNSAGQRLTSSVSDPENGSTRISTTSYCEQSGVDLGTCVLLGQVVMQDGPRSDVDDTTFYTYFPSSDAACANSPASCAHRKGDLWKVTNALGQVSEILRYDGAGRVLSVKDANGVITEMEYHPRGWLTARKVRGADDGGESDDRITRIEYEPTGLVKKTTLPDGSYTSFTYDAAHRLTDITDREGNRIHYTLDNAGNKIKEDTIGQNGTVMRTLSRVYNQLGQLQTAADAQYNQTDFVYDANGYTETVTDALGRVTYNGYDPLGRLSHTIQDLGGINATTEFEYDAKDNLTAVIDPKALTTRYTYNGLGDITGLSSPDTGTTTYTYDSAGNRKTQTDARLELATYDYDALNRLISIRYSTPALNVIYVYDLSNAICDPEERFPVGRLTALTDASGTTEYCYDRFGQLTRKVQTTNGIALTLRYTYTKSGQLDRVIYPDGAIVDYVRDAQGRITEVGTTTAGGVREVVLHQATYFPFGSVAGWTFGNGRSMQRTLNQNYQPQTILDDNPGGLSLGYAFNPVGNLGQLNDGFQSTILARYDYDALNRLTDTRDGPTGAVIEHYGYDATGNRTSLTNAGGTDIYTYPATSHRLTRNGTVFRLYDEAGNTTWIGGNARQFVYDAAGRMRQVKVGGVVTMNYRYNGRGEQVRRYRGTNNTYTVYDESGHWLGDYDSSGAAMQQAIWLDDLPVGLWAGAGGNQTLHYIEPDALGSPRVVIDPQRDVAVWTWDLTGESFGATVPKQDPDSDGTAFIFDMRFPGQRYDVASGLNYNYFRDYDASTGRYAESDPIGIAGGPSTYSYVGNSPLGAIDTLGLKWFCKTTEDPYSYRKWFDSDTTYSINARIPVGFFVAPQGFPKSGFTPAWESFRGKVIPIPTPNFEWRIFYIYENIKKGAVSTQQYGSHETLTSCDNIISECGRKKIIDHKLTKDTKIEKIGSPLSKEFFDYYLEIIDKGEYLGPTP